MGDSIEFLIHLCAQKGQFSLFISIQFKDNIIVFKNISLKPLFLLLLGKISVKAMF